jgi:hypothetical protein
MALKEKLLNGEKLTGIWDCFNLEEMGVEYHVTETEHWLEE